MRNLTLFTVLVVATCSLTLLLLFHFSNNVVQATTTNNKQQQQKQETQQQKQENEKEESTPPKPVELNLVFASCNKHDQDQSYWRKVLEWSNELSDQKVRDANPEQKNKKLDALLWLGDIVYLDALSPLNMIFPIFISYNLSTQAEIWHAQKNNKYYQEVISQTRHIAGVFDDHDLGLNDVGKEYPHKEFSQKNLLDFLDVPVVTSTTPTKAESRIRREVRKGVYQFLKIPLGDNNNNNGKMNVCAILLDVRTHRDSAKSDGSGDVLGEEQWSWFEKVLQKGVDPDFSSKNDEEDNNNNNVKTIDDTCVVTFIGSGVQVLADSAPAENWGEFPESRDKLLRTLKKSGSRRFVLLSGDVHHAAADTLFARAQPKPTVDPKTKAYRLQQYLREASEPASSSSRPAYQRCGESPFAEHGQDLQEYTSSGLTHEFHFQFISHSLLSYLLQSHRGATELYLKKNVGIINVKCADSTKQDSCRVFITLHDIRTGNIIHRDEAKFFNLEPLSKEELEMQRSLSCPTNLEADHYSLPLYYSELTHLVMFYKKHLFFLEEAGRLTVIWCVLYTIIIFGLIIPIMLSCWCWKWSRNQRHEHQKID